VISLAILGHFCVNFDILWITKEITNNRF